MSGRPRKGRQVAFSREDGNAVSPDPDPVIGLRFTISAQNGGEALIDFTALRPRRLALAAGRALRHLAAPGGPLGARSTIKAFAVTIPKFFAYLADAGELVAGIETLRAWHVDGFEGWLEARMPSPRPSHDDEVLGLEAVDNPFGHDRGQQLGGLHPSQPRLKRVFDPTPG